ncbi:hypothetical protein BH09PSE2_BH09PSE2_21580 [soil metagenome]
MAKLKSERHHWWPMCLSRHWVDQAGMIGWINPSGTVRRVSPKNLGLIGNGHAIKLASGGDSPWDQSYEGVFAKADSAFPPVISWAEALYGEFRPQADLQDRYTTHAATDEQLSLVSECIISLVVRSPRSRDSAVALAEHYRGPLPERERNALIGLNLRNAQADLSRSFGSRGKFCIIHSPEHEFIFGDGFFFNIHLPAQSVHTPKIVVPLTPTLAIGYTKPMSYVTEPRICSLVITASEANGINEGVQVYSKDALFFRDQQPLLVEAFSSGEYRRYVGQNQADMILKSIPGAEPPRNLFFGLPSSSWG